MIFIFALWCSIKSPDGVRAYDTPNDAGKSINIEWKLAADDSLLVGYEVFRATNNDTFQYVGNVVSGNRSFKDTKVEDGLAYRYKIRSKTTNEYSDFSLPSAQVVSAPQWYHKGKTITLIGLLLFSSLILGAIVYARKGKHLFIRRIAGLDELDEAVGRATEMGKPLLYVPGLSGMTDIATIASVNILSQVARKTAEYSTPIIVPNRDPIVMTVTQEVVKEAYLEKGRPEGYNADNVFFLTDSQFAYAAGVCGIMMRDKPATNLFIGMFYAESLLLAETGNMTGAIQIAGTDAVTQLPFFITACDYTIMGEELYAASAYISKEPLLLGSIKGQDYSKLIVLFFILVGSIFGLMGNRVIISLFNI